MANIDIRRYQANRQAEIDSAFLYRTLAKAERKAQISQVYERLAATEEKHALFWEKKLSAAGATVARLWAEKRDGTPVLTGTASVGAVPDDAH
ncbi:MAG TPA: rubrerythrin family protein, partial [Acidobacteria bacterium]|nr:rubrerythrin family protein [Acidobacteriota bacterium]